MVAGLAREAFLKNGVRCVGVIAATWFSTAYACSPGEGSPIGTNLLISWSLFVFAVGIVVFGFVYLKRRGAKWSLAIVLSLLVVHPGWWMSVLNGDCGYLKLLGSILLTSVIAVIVGVKVLRLRKNHDGARP